MRNTEQKTRALEFDWHQTKTFLRVAYPKAFQKNFFELRLVNNKGRPRVKQFWLGQDTQIDWQEVEHLNGQGWNVYFGPALRKEKKEPVRLSLRYPSSGWTWMSRDRHIPMRPLIIREQPSSHLWNAYQTSCFPQPSRTPAMAFRLSGFYKSR